ncbi:DUF2238 domain-containing protein [Desulfohalobiaceae bacterium Ax17]|uniref:DUF2238 domain-containing protein n=1 Tax=Desulfovulcanus ferrireducens TaxID=2831190 RepID=UPI00207BCA93|nr:DUF2238 domain-containing protein [Desulfovulcanus ferrireducens]MBT8763160.1 DUF2238 domain-containing protein [Desulfovulcanus ferrireducens]
MSNGSKLILRKRSNLEPLLLLAIATVALIISAIHPYNWIVWFLEVFPVLVGGPILIVTYRDFRLTPLLYRLILIHALILILGAHYTYARVPLGFWFQDLLDLSRNHYDRVGHIAQGFIPAILAREILLRRSPLVPGKWLFFLVVCVCLAFSSFYELIEWWAAIIGGQAADTFLATQGDVWDTQWDMFLALLGAIVALLTLSGVHDRALEQLQEA